MTDLDHTVSWNPARFAESCYDEARGLSAGQLRDMQLHWIRRRFSEMRPHLQVLERLAGERGVDTIECLENVVPLLFPHTVFKSYPLGWIEQSRFDLLTRWLAGFSLLDLSGVDSSGLDSIDGWIERLDERTELRVIHTFGTTGKLSFIPRTREEWRVGGLLVARCIRDWHGRGSCPDLLTARLPIVCPSYRFGAGAIQRGVASAVEAYAGGNANTLFLYPETRFSADIASLAGRLRAAELRGDSGEIVLTPYLKGRREEFARLERDRVPDLSRFFAETVRRYSGQNLYLLGVWPVLYDWACAGLNAGLRSLFGPHTVLHTGGGTKGRELPEGWRERIYEFLGVERHHEFYAMSELIAGSPRCTLGNYHLPPVTVPFLLHPKTGDLLPAHDRLRGRFAAFDLLASHSWGGVVSGDEVTLGGWDRPCTCGRGGLYVEPDIRRYAVTEGGSDKISCARANDVYRSAIEVFTEAEKASA